MTQLLLQLPQLFLAHQLEVFPLWLELQAPQPLLLVDPQIISLIIVLMLLLHLHQVRTLHHFLGNHFTVLLFFIIQLGLTSFHSFVLRVLI